MTTVAYSKGEIACDKQASDSGMIGRASYKAQVIGNSVYICAGTLTRGRKFVQWLTEAAEDTPAPPLKGTQVIEMSLKTGKAVLWEDDIPQPIEEQYYAWGSGSHLAVGAMAFGATPAQAVSVATKHDEGTGGGVQVFTSQPAARRKL
jgi:hypothetical protein